MSDGENARPTIPPSAADLPNRRFNSRAVFEMSPTTREKDERRRKYERFRRLKAESRFDVEGRHNMGGCRIGFATDELTQRAMNVFLRGGRLA